MRLINADELITAFPCGESIRTESVRATINHMPTIEQPTWVPCSERLPNKYKTVLTTSKDGRVRENFINVGGWSYDTYAVVAWMPLPEPWKGAEDE